MLSPRTSTFAVSLTLSSLAIAQPTVPFSSPAWQDFGTTDITGLTGNFLPGWTVGNASPDLGDDVFFIANESFSGVDDDAALWMLGYHPSSAGYVSTETAVLSLSGFTIGNTYEIGFAATLVQHSFAGWNATSDQLEATLTGASISTWTSTVLTDAGDADGLNTWDTQLISFVATDTTVSIAFGDGSTTPGVDIVSRIGIDAFRVVPAPGTAGLIAAGGLLAWRRRR